MLCFLRVFSQIGKGKGINGSMPKLYIRYGTDTGTLCCRGGVLALLFLSLSTLICGYLFFTAGQVAVAAAFWLFSSLLVLLVLLVRLFLLSLPVLLVLLLLLVLLILPVLILLVLLILLVHLILVVLLLPLVLLVRLFLLLLLLFRILLFLPIFLVLVVSWSSRSLGPPDPPGPLVL